MVTPAEREFVVFRRGEVRDDMLRFHRAGLRQLTDPDTGVQFTEDTIRRATAVGSRFYVEADGLDLVCQGIQKRDEFLAQQMRIDRAGSTFLVEYHGAQWGETLLPASGGGGPVRATGLVGTTWIGSTQVPDAFASQAVDAAGNRYQVLVTGSAGADGTALLLLVGIDGGFATNLPEGSELTWTNPPPGAATTATVAEDFTGGAPDEDDAAFSARLASRVRHKPGAGNSGQVRALTRAASSAVADGFVYPCALNAGSVIVAPLQKRGRTVGPTARIPGAAVLAAVTSVVVPPGSPFLAPAAFVVVLPPTSEPTNVTLGLSLRRGSAAGWLDIEPFPPARSTGPVLIASVTSQTQFTITTDAAGQLPNGATEAAGVSLMVWDVPTSRFVQLASATVEDLTGGSYGVTLVEAPAGHTLAVGDFVCPSCGRAAAIAEGVEAYFDSLGPGEVVRLSSDPLGARAFRFPLPAQEAPARAGVQVLNYVADALGESAADSTLKAIDATAPLLPEDDPGPLSALPKVPSDPIDGPALLTLGKLGVYDF